MELIGCMCRMRGGCSLACCSPSSGADLQDSGAKQEHFYTNNCSEWGQMSCGQKPGLKGSILLLFLSSYPPGPFPTFPHSLPPCPGFLFIFSCITFDHTYPFMTPILPQLLHWFDHLNYILSGSNWFTSCKMTSEFTREACDVQLRVGIMPVCALDTNKLKLMSKDTLDFLSSFPFLSTCN